MVTFCTRIVLLFLPLQLVPPSADMTRAIEFYSRGEYQKAIDMLTGSYEDTDTLSGTTFDGLFAYLMFKLGCRYSVENMFGK